MALNRQLPSPFTEIGGGGQTSGYQVNWLPVDLVANYGTVQRIQRLQLEGARISNRYALDVLPRQKDFDWQPQTNAAMQGQSCMLNPCKGNGNTYRTMMSFS